MIESITVAACVESAQLVIGGEDVIGDDVGLVDGELLGDDETDVVKLFDVLGGIVTELEGLAEAPVDELPEDPAVDELTDVMPVELADVLIPVEDAELPLPVLPEVVAVELAVPELPLLAEFDAPAQLLGHGRVQVERHAMSIAW